MQRVRSGSPRLPGVSKSGERRTSAAKGFVEITHGPGGGGFEAQRRRHYACDTWEWLVPPKTSQLPPVDDGGGRQPRTAREGLACGERVVQCAWLWAVASGLAGKFF
jgi:hypothetical protein